MQPRQNIAKSACEIVEEEVRRLFINKSSEALRNIPAKEILTSKVVEHINSYYKLGQEDYIDFSFEDDKKNLRIENENIIYNENNHSHDSYIWIINFIHDYENFCRKLPFWSLSLSISRNNETLFSIITNPILNLLIFSEKGSGSVNNQRKVRSVTSSEEIMISKSNDITVPANLSKFKSLSLNSVSIELIFLCMGIIDIFVLSHSDYNKYQDCILIAKEAGILLKEHDKYLLLANEKNMATL